MDKASMIKEIEARKLVIAAERDALRKILDELETEINSLDRGVEALEAAIDALSEHV